MVMVITRSSETTELMSEREGWNRGAALHIGLSTFILGVISKSLVQRRQRQVCQNMESPRQQAQTNCTVAENKLHKKLG